MYKICSPPIWAIYEGHVCYLKIIAEDIRKDALMMQLLSTVEVIEDPVLMMYSPIWGDYMDWDIRIERSMNNLSSEWMFMCVYVELLDKNLTINVLYFSIFLHLEKSKIISWYN